MGNLKAACAAVASYLLFIPADETMLHNKDYYSSRPKVKEEYFTPREVCEKTEKYKLSRVNDYIFNIRKISKEISAQFMYIGKIHNVYSHTKCSKGKIINFQHLKKVKIRQMREKC